ncbi:MAG TPA: amino acid deaminase [Steroidobacteraceae bacterium]|nr:amino acid deaminase [Steroidobacteraceae bacterium]
MLDLTALSRHTLSSASKGIPDILDGVTIEDAPKRRLNLLRDEFPAPVAVIRESALRANIELMRQYTESAGVRLAPHGKTTMCPQLFDLQLAAGAWGMTCATAAHLRVYRRFGVPRIIMANQLLDADCVRFVARELAADPGFEFFGIVDSVAGARQYYDVLSKLPRGRALNLLLEVGAAGGRTGVRTVEEALVVAREVAGLSDSLRLAGIEAFEGIFPGTPAEAEVNVEAFMKQVSEIARRCDAEHLFGESVVLTAGGSAYFDQVVKALGSVRLSRPTKVILRSGCYITHDHGTYATALDRLRQRSTGSVFADHGFEPALELWTTVQSLPEPGLAIVALGKRDVSFDMGLPVPLKRHRQGDPAGLIDLRGKAEIVRLNDHHGYLKFAGLDLAVKDRIAVGISHPCTTFDRWEYLYRVDDRYDVVSIVRTFF